MDLSEIETLKSDLRACRLCADRFRGTKTAHSPRPVIWFRSTARLLVAGQAPGMRVHESGTPFTDRSGDRLRDWMGVNPETFYDKKRVAVLPMAFCFPGYNAKGADLPPPPICARTWHDRVLPYLPDLRLILAVGGYAQKWYLGPAAKSGVTATVAAWRSFLPQVLPLPHPSWRNTAWLKRNPWFEAELLPELRDRVRSVLESP